MAGRPRNRLELRRQAEAAELRSSSGHEPQRGLANPRARGGKGPVRVCARWGVFDATMKRVAVFDYGQRALADQKVAELNALRTGTFFVQLVKEEVCDQRDDED